MKFQNKNKKDVKVSVVRERGNVDFYTIPPSAAEIRTNDQGLFDALMKLDGFKEVKPPVAKVEEPSKKIKTQPLKVKKQKEETE